MMEIPRTRYATTREGVCVAYQVFGDGPFDLVYSPGWVTNIEVLWEWPGVAQVFSRLASRCRVVLYDKQGTGLSDRVASLPGLEARMDDVIAVMDGAGMSEAALLGPTQGAAVSALFAATYPERVSAFIPYGGFARTMWSHDWPYGARDDEPSDWEDHLTLDEWGTQEWAYRFCVDWGAEALRHDRDFLTWLAKMMRFSATPTAAAAFNSAFDDTDVRDVLPSVAAPSLLLYRANQDEQEEVEATAALIPLARVLELPGDIGARTSAIRSRWRERSRTSSTASTIRRATSTACSPPCCSPISRTRRRRRPTSAIEHGGSCVERHHAIVRALLDEVPRHGDRHGGRRLLRVVRRAGTCRAVRAGRSSRQPAGSGSRCGRCAYGRGRRWSTARSAASASNIGARVGAAAVPSEMLVSQTVKDLTAGSGLAFEDAGEHELKGVPDRWRLYRVIA